MVRTLLLENLSMENIKKALPLDVVLERRTERCCPRFRPGDRFRDLRFRYLSPDSEAEKCRRLDHRQIPFIHSSRFMECSNFYIYIQHSVLQAISSIWCVEIRLGMVHISPLRIHSWPRLRAIINVLLQVLSTRVVHRVALGVVLRAGVSVFNTNLKYDKTSLRFNHLGL